jgi:hypothetical protein
MSTLAAENVEEIIRRYGAQPVWAVISTFAADSLYDGLTYAEARATAKKEEAREPGRSAVVVLVVEALPGTPL